MACPRPPFALPTNAPGGAGPSQVGPPPPPATPCRPKPLMRGLHWSQTTKVMTQTLALCAIAGVAVAVFYTKARRDRYKEFYTLTDFEEWADEMAKKGLFDAAPKGEKK